MTLLAPFIAWVAGGIVAWLAGRYHLDANQQQLVSIDLIGAAGFAASAAGGLWMHWKARLAPPLPPSNPKP